MSHSHKSHRKKHFRRSTKPGTKPGHIDVDPNAPKPTIQAFGYGDGKFEERRSIDVNQLQEFIGRFKHCWVNVDGLGDAATIARLGEIFSLHPLALEDVVHVHQRPKVEQYAGHIFVVTRMLRVTSHLESEQMSLFVGQNFLLTFQEAIPGDCLDLIRDRMRNLSSTFHSTGPDYLAYRVIDAVIDSYFPVLEHYGERIEEIEEELLANSKSLEIARIHTIKQELLQVRRTVWPTRDMVHALIRDPNTLVREETRIFLRDCYDHTVQIIDLLETYRELGSDLRDLYLSSVSNRMNEIMKVLTIISTLFIPLTFIVGIYGMNFNTEVSPYNMPELNWRYGYVACWSLMIVVMFFMALFFYRKGWIGEKSRKN